MILEETINQFIRDIINNILAMPNYSIKAKQKDAPRPDFPYADVDFVSDTSLGWEQNVKTNRAVDEDLDVVYEGMREISFSVNFYRDNAIDNARKFRTGLVRDSIQSLFKEANLGLIRRSEVREISDAWRS